MGKIKYITFIAFSSLYDVSRLLLNSKMTNQGDYGGFLPTPWRQGIGNGKGVESFSL
jgi:hypothetical protein